jgi:tRNA pseudouridine13 synthase
MSSPARPEVGREEYLSKCKGIGGKLRKIPEDFEVLEFIETKAKPHWTWAQENKDGRHCIVKITSKNWDTHMLVKELSRRLGIGQRAIGFAGTKDKRAISTQYFSLMSSTEKIKKLEINNIDLELMHRTIKPIRLGNLIGNRFKIKITGTDGNKKKINDILGQLNGGFPNYFGIQRFGAVRPITHLVGKKIVRGDYQGAVWDYLTKDGSDTMGSEAREFLRENRDWKAALKKFPYNLLFERQIIGHLSRNQDDYIGALGQLPENLSKMLVHGYQSLIFNRVLEQRLREGLNIQKPLIGDNVIPADNYGGPDQRKIIEVTERNQAKLEKRCGEGKAWIAGLLPGVRSEYTGGVQGAIEKAVMDEEKIRFKDFIIEDMPELTSLGMYRPLHQNINELEWEFDENRNPIFNFWLYKGTYATSFLREIMKCEDMRAY